MFSSNRRVIAIFCGVLLVTLLVSGTALAQSRIARANSTVGQKAIFKVIGNQTPVCIGVYTVDPYGNLMTFTSLYVAPLSTQQVVPQVTPAFPTTTMFAIYEPGPGLPGAACAVAPALGSFINDPTREPTIYETLSGGDTPVVNVKQIAGLINVGVSICGNLVSNNQVNGNGLGVSVRDNGVNNQNNNFGIDCGTVRAISGIAQIANTTAVITYGFDDIEFTDSTGDALASLISNCQSAQYSTNNGFTITCTLPNLPGNFNGQHF